MWIGEEEGGVISPGRILKHRSTTSTRIITMLNHKNKLEHPKSLFVKLTVDLIRILIMIKL